MSIKSGVVAVQGAVSEHIEALERAFKDAGRNGKAVTVRRKPDLEGVEALVLPGGESTTISKLLVKFGLFDEIVKRAGEGMPILGTCAGMVLLAKEGDQDVERTGTKLLGLMDASVDRNAFGRQRESFEAEITVNVKEKEFNKPLNAVFIRAPVIKRVWGSCKALSSIDEGIILAEQGHLIAAAFHPELTADTRLHRRLLSKI